MSATHDPGDAFVVGDRIIYSAQYHLGDCSVIVWFNGAGRDANGGVCHSDPKRAIVTAKPGDVILYGGQRRTVKRVEVFRQGRMSNVSHGVPLNYGLAEPFTAPK